MIQIGIHQSYDPLKKVCKPQGYPETIFQDRPHDLAAQSVLLPCQSLSGYVDPRNPFSIAPTLPSPSYHTDL